MYFTLANLDPAVRSRLEAINLVALFKSELLVNYSLDEILTPFIKETEYSNLCVTCDNNYYVIVTTRR